MKTVTVRLLMSHRHDGEQKNTGDSLTVSVEIANWLISRHVAKLSNEETTKDKGEKP